MYSLFSTGTLATSSSIFILPAKAESAVVPSEVGQTSALAVAADGGGAPALVRALRTDLVVGQAEGRCVHD